jgi:RNA polymerase sigma factor (sigma-70 family)
MTAATSGNSRRMEGAYVRVYAPRVTIGRPGAVSPGVNAVPASLEAPRSLGPPAFADVVADHLDAVYRYLVYLTGDRSAAEDLAAETFEKAFRSWRRFDPRRSAPRTWLCRIARSEAIDWFRAETRRRRREETYARDLDATEEPVFAEGLPPALVLAIRALAPAERAVVALRVLLELDGPSAARVLGISQTACSTRLSRALQRLEELMSDVGE